MLTRTSPVAMCQQPVCLVCAWSMDGVPIRCSRRAACSGWFGGVVPSFATGRANGGYKYGHTLGRSMQRVAPRLIRSTGDVPTHHRRTGLMIHAFLNGHDRTVIGDSASSTAVLELPFLPDSLRRVVGLARGRNHESTLRSTAAS